MILTVPEPDLPAAVDRIGLGRALTSVPSSLIKINLTRPPAPGHPRTDPALLTTVVRYVLDHGASCTLATCAYGRLRENLEGIGLSALLAKPGVRVVDLDDEEAEIVIAEGEEQYVPRCLRDFGVRLAIPMASQRPGLSFSANVKLFMGAVPRRFYQTGEGSQSRPRLHIDLPRSIVSVYRAVQAYAPFRFFLVGGLATDARRGDFRLDPCYVGDDPVELDLHLARTVFEIEPPEYLRRLQEGGRAS